MRSIFLTTLLIFALSCDSMKEKPLIIGHRGAMGHETENTLVSIQKALDIGVDMIEIDVFRIASGEIVVFHDERVDRLTDGQGRIEEYQWDDLLNLVVEGGHQIPRLEEVLELIQNKVALNIELKGRNTSEGVNALIQQYTGQFDWDSENFLISSFHWDELRSMRSMNPEIAIAVLTADDPINALPVARKLGAVGINPHYSTLSADKVKQIHEAGFKVYTYTVNEPEDIARMIDFGVDGIFINYPERMP